MSSSKIKTVSCFVKKVTAAFGIYVCTIIGYSKSIVAQDLL